MEFAILAQIQRQGAVSIVDLADFFMRDRSSIRYKLAPLERAGFVALVPDDRDARARRIMLTEAGKAKLAEATSLWQGAQQKFEAAVGTEQAIAMRKAADLIATVSFDLATDV